jgi:hypothetical protein
MNNLHTSKINKFIDNVYSVLCFSSTLPPLSALPLPPPPPGLLDTDASLCDCMDMASSSRSSSPARRVAAVEERIAMQCVVPLQVGFHMNIEVACMHIINSTTQI